MESQSDAELLRRYLVGDNSAFEVLQKRYANLVFSICLRECRDRGLAEDAAQSTFLLLIQKAGGLVRHRSLAGWFFQSARLVTRNLMRTEQRMRARERAALSVPAETEAWSDLEPHLNETLADLPSQDREVLLLRFFNEFSLAEVGSSLGVSENSARMRVNRALERMRKQLSKRGVVVSALMLLVLMEQHAAEAAPVGVLQLPEVGLQVPAGSFALLSKPLLLGGIVFGGLVASWFVGLEVQRSTELAKVRSAFQSVVGTWRGDLEYADDSSKKRIKFPTTVTVETDSAAFQWTARYGGTDRVDVTRFEGRRDGSFAISNGGEKSSHRLDGAYRVRSADGGKVVFEGVSVAVAGEVRLTLDSSGGSIILREEVRRAGSNSFAFRNQFSLSR